MCSRDCRTRCRPRPYSVIKQAVETELQRPLSDVFASFNEEPIASASLAQVHKATLKDGRVVAVKVQYPGIQETVETDLREHPVPPAHPLALRAQPQLRPDH